MFHFKSRQRERTYSAQSRNLLAVRRVAFVLCQWNLIFWPIQPVEAFRCGRAAISFPSRSCRIHHILPLYQQAPHRLRKSTTPYGEFTLPPQYEEDLEQGRSSIDDVTQSSEAADFSDGMFAPSAQPSADSETAMLHQNISPLSSTRQLYEYRPYQLDDHSDESFDNGYAKYQQRYHNATAYQFWEERLSIHNFGMDLCQLAMYDAQRAQVALEIMLEWSEQKPQNPWVVRPDASCYLIIMEGWIHAGQLKKAQSWFDHMEALFIESTDRPVDSDPAQEVTWSKTVATTNTSAVIEYMYHSMAKAWAEQSKDDFGGKSAYQADTILARMQERGLKPSISLFGVVLQGWCKRVGLVRGAMKRAEAMLTRMEQEYAPSSRRNEWGKSGEEGVEHNSKLSYDSGERPHPLIYSYTTFIGGLSRSKENDLARRAEAVLDRMTKNGIAPNVVVYTAVLNCWGKAVSLREREIGAARALRILETMERMYLLKEEYHVKPTVITYATAIAAIGNSVDPDAPHLAEEILGRMYKLHESGAIANVKPTTSTYNAVIHALSSVPGSSNRLRYAKRAEQIVAEMNRRSKTERDVQPDVRTWAALLRAWTRSGVPNAPEQAQRVLDELIALYQRGETNVRPNYVCYTTVMGAWGNSRRKDALDKLDNLLRFMEKEYEETLEADIRPNTVSYVTAMDAFIRRNDRDAAQRVQALVERMTALYQKGLGHVRPTRIVLNTLIHAWSKSKDKGAANKAESIFRWMEEQYRLGDVLVRPDEVSLCAVLNAWANQAENGGAERALHIWEYSKAHALEERGFQPTIMMPNIVIKAIARSKNPGAVQMAEDILLQLESEFRAGISVLRPDVTTYSSVINACAYYLGDAAGRSQALATALRTFQKACDLGESMSNNITFGTILKAIGNLMPAGEERNTLVRSLFDQACERGLVDIFVLSQIRAANPELYAELAEGLGQTRPDESVSAESILQNLPKIWSSNVVS